MHLKAGIRVNYCGLYLEVLDATCAETITLIDRDGSGEIYQCKASEITLPTANGPLPLALHETSDWLEWDGLAKAVRNILAAETLAERKQRYEASAITLGCSIRTLQRKVKVFRACPTVSAMRHGKSGRRTGTRMLSSKVEEIIAMQLHKQWLQENKPLLTDVIDHIQSECRKLQYPVPSPTTIRKRSDALCEHIRIKCREGAKALKYKLEPLTGHIEATKALEMIQIDHTRADVLLVSELDSSIVVGRPWITLAIDVASRMIAGVYITLEAPSAVSVGMCLANALLPKSEFLQKLNLAGEWPVEGIMACIHTDNGKEFHSEALQRGCSELGIDMQERPVDSPHYGGTIERVIGTFMGKCRLLPGCTQRNVPERGDYDAEGKAVMTLQQFTAFFVNEIVNVYHVTQHRGLGISPLVKWRDLANEYRAGRPLPAGYERWQLPTLFYPFEMRKIRRTGIELHTRLYWSEALSEWIGREEKCAIHFHPGDASKVYLRGPNGSLVIATHTGGDKHCTSFEEIREQRRINNERSRTTELVAQKDAGLATRSSLIEQAKKSKKKGLHRSAAIKKEHEEQTRNVPVPANTEPAIASAPIALVFDRNVHDIASYRKRA